MTVRPAMTGEQDPHLRSDQPAAAADAQGTWAGGYRFDPAHTASRAGSIERIWHQPRPAARLSVVLLDWQVRESFHSLDYLSRQTVPRDAYEVIWIEYYSRRARPIDERMGQARAAGREAPLDQWIVMGMSEEAYYHKHLMYNVGIAASQGRIVVLCDSDAIFRPTFVESIVNAFEERPQIVLHLDEVRNVSRSFYPFNYPPIESITGEGAINWRNGKTTGLADQADPLHSRNYGACMCAWRDDLIAIGGADEHDDYLGHVCGPYELTFRLRNYGRTEVWHETELLYHVWHPGQAGDGNVVGPHDGSHVSTRALQALASGRREPWVENPVIGRLRRGEKPDFERLARWLVEPKRAAGWTRAAVAVSPRHRLWHEQSVLATYKQFNIVRSDGRFFGTPTMLGPVDLNNPEEAAHPAILSGSSPEAVRNLIEAFDLAQYEPRLAGQRAGYNLVAYRGRVYAVPMSLGEVNFPRGQAEGHPDIIVADSIEAIQSVLAELLRGPKEPELLGEHEGYNLVRFQQSVYGIPQNLGPVDLYCQSQRERAQIIAADEADGVRSAIDARLRSVAVEFAGWLPAFKRFGNCGAHPQFAHVNEPPPGYQFIQSDPRAASGGGVRGRLGQWARRVRGTLRAAGAMWRLGAACLDEGVPLKATLSFLRSRHLPSQSLLGESKGLVFLPSVPYTYGQYPWVIEIEDTTSLLFPFVHNGRTATGTLDDYPCLAAVRVLLESRSCRGIVTHMRSTAETLPILFDSEVIGEKTSHVPLGVPLPKLNGCPARTDRLELLFSNSWHQDPRSFFIRGGLDVLEAFARLKPRYPAVRLTLRTSLPERLDPRYRQIIEEHGVRVLSEFMPLAQWDALRRGAHVFLLPSDRIHIVSVLQAMSYGMAVVVSDGWGMEEYVQHNRNGLVVTGRYGKVTWIDQGTGLLREDYEVMERADRNVVDQLVEQVERLIVDDTLRLRLGGTARRDVETQYNVANWNRGLKKVFDRAMAAGAAW